MKSRTNPETRIQASILTYLVYLGIFCWRNNSSGIYNQKTGSYYSPKGIGRISGVSDILGILPDGRFIALEIKSEKGKETPEQKVFGHNISTNNGLYIVARSIEDVRKTLREYGYLDKTRDILLKPSKSQICDPGSV